MKLMKRPAAPEKVLERVQEWRRVNPDITLRSTFIVGFPGETEREFEELLAFLRAADLDRVGCFAYSPVEGAAANALPDAVPDEVKEERREQLMTLQAKISEARLRTKVGREIVAMVDAIKGNVTVARSTGDAPEVDGVVRVRGLKRAQPGDFINVRVTSSNAHDLEGRVQA